MRIFKADVERICTRCETEMTFFIQHSHGNYPVIDYLCPNCDLVEKERQHSAEAADEGAGPSE